jgi:hypothetical protein
MCALTAVLLLSSAAAQDKGRMALIDANLPSYKPQPVAQPEGHGWVMPDGSVRIVGFDDMAGMVAKWDAEFTKTHPGIRFTPLLRGNDTAIPAITYDMAAFAPEGGGATLLELLPYEKPILDIFGVDVSDELLSPARRKVRTQERIGGFACRLRQFRHVLCSELLHHLAHCGRPRQRLRLTLVQQSYASLRMCPHLALACERGRAECLLAHDAADPIAPLPNLSPACSFHPAKTAPLICLTHDYPRSP